MAKQRLRPKLKATAPSRLTDKAVERSRPVSSGSSEHAAPPSLQPGAPRRSTEAVALYERGVEALQRHDYNEAIRLLESVLQLFPEEKELHERVNLYLNICKRQVGPKVAAPQTLDERLYAATLAINGGRYDEALTHLHLVRDEDPDNDHALYMLAVAHAQRDEHAQAIAHLERAIALNPENRALARRDPDLDPLHEDEAFRAALETASSGGAPPIQPSDRRHPVRTKSAR
jgi:tetratricopeptide (TPR) repeat protein